VSDPLDDLDRSVSAALSDTETSVARLTDFVERVRNEYGDEIEIDYFGADLTYERAEVIGTWPNGEPMTVFYGCRRSED
jgi:hypothetical protein